MDMFHTQNRCPDHVSTPPEASNPDPMAPSYWYGEESRCRTGGTFNTTVKNLGVNINQHLLSDKYIELLSPNWLSLPTCGKSKKISAQYILTQNDTDKLVHEFVTCRPDYCNESLARCSNSSIKFIQFIHTVHTKCCSKGSYETSKM
ncbi:hypothetical protein XENORESO_019694 [Xenotaenia resolanae]|uniref:Uncharacterized protein n=1 Tax=Xenotaenia resolanae TaxID=208358 RepID=A0ABV0VL28_9TELE